MNRPVSPVRARDRLDDLVDADAAARVDATVDRPGPIATVVAIGSGLFLGVLAGSVVYAIGAGL